VTANGRVKCRQKRRPSHSEKGSNVGMVHSQTAQTRSHTTKQLGRPDLEVSQVQVARRLGRESCHHFPHFCAGQVNVELAHGLHRPRTGIGEKDGSACSTRHGGMRKIGTKTEIGMKEA